MRRSPRKYWEGNGRKIIMIPSKSINKLLATNKFLNIVYLTDIGYYPKANSHFIDRVKGSPENIIFYCAEGTGWYQTAEGYFTVYPNQFFFLPANQKHRYGTDAENPWTIYWIMFEGNLSDINLSEGLVHFKRPNSLVHPQKFIDLFNYIDYILSRGFTCKNLVLANMNLWNIIMMFACNRKDNVKEEQESPVTKVITLMEKNIDQKMTVAKMAGSISYSSSHLHSIFRLATGYSPLNYFIHLKMMHACRYLTSTNLKIREIASKIGYDDPFLFSRIFRKVNGISPQKYRSTIKV